MSDIKNGILHHYAYPIAFLGAAYIGSHLPHYFPGTNREGLLLSAGLGSSFLMTSKQWPTEKESRFIHLTQVVVSIGLAVIATPIIAKALTGRISITLPTALRFGLFETAITLGIDLNYPPFQQTLAQKHRAFSETPDLWMSLSAKERGEYSKKFFDANLTPIQSPIHINFDFSPFFPIPRVSSLSPSKTEWYHFILARTDDITPFIKEGPIGVSVLHSYFTKNPIEFWSQKKIHILVDLFKDKAKINRINEALHKVLPTNIKTLSTRAVSFLHQNLKSKTWKTKWIDLSRMQQKVLNERFKILALNKLRN